MSKHADHALSECPNPDFCEMLAVWRITNNRTGTSHAAENQTYEDYLSDEPGAYGIPDGLTRDEYAALQRPKVIRGSEVTSTELYSMTWEKI